MVTRMPDRAPLYADRIVNIAVTGPLVRIELGAMKLPSGEGQKPEILSVETLVIPLDGFLQSFGLMETVVKKLVADGVIRPQAAPGPA
jgi:hypothetical protein